MEDKRTPSPIGPSMRKVLDEIAATQRERDAAATSLPMAHSTTSAVDRRTGTAQDELIACWQRQTEQLQALLHEAAEQTRLLGEILARFPPAPSAGQQVLPRPDRERP